MKSSSLFRYAAVGLLLQLGGGCRSTSANPSLVATPVDEPPPSLLDRVSEIHEEQGEAFEDFRAAHDTFRRLTRPQASDLKGLERELRRRVRACERDAEELSERIALLEEHNADVVEAWRARIEQVPDDRSRSRAREALKETVEATEKLSAAMRGVHKAMAPVLVAFQDYLLFFDHNLNARAIAALEDTYEPFGQQVEALLNEIQRTREELAHFLGQAAPGISVPSPTPTSQPDDAPSADSPAQPPDGAPLEAGPNGQS